MAAKGKHSQPGKGNIYAKANEVMTSKDGVRMLMIYSPAGTEGIFADMHALSQDQLTNAELTKQLALKHDTVMIEQSKDGRGKGTILG